MGSHAGCVVVKLLLLPPVLVSKIHRQIRHPRFGLLFPSCYRVLHNFQIQEPPPTDNRGFHEAKHQIIALFEVQVKKPGFFKKIDYTVFNNVELKQILYWHL